MMLQVATVLLPTPGCALLTAATQPAQAETSRHFTVLQQPTPIVIDVVILIVAAQLGVQLLPHVATWCC